MNAQHVWSLIEAWREGRGEGKDYPVRNWAEEVQWYEDYAEGSSGSEHTRGVVSANWNDLDVYDPATKKRVKVSDIPSRMCDLFERLGFLIEWSDQVTSCGGCGKCILTEPDCMSWGPGFMVGDGAIECAECCESNAEAWLDQCAEEGAHWNLDNIDPEQHGWTLAFEAEDFLYADKLAKVMKGRGFERGEWLFTQSRSYECDVYVKDDAYEEYLDREAAKETEQKETSFKLSTPMSMSRYREACECLEGFCPCCGDWTAEQCEPDAKDRKCEHGDCGRSWVVGAENAMIMGLIEIVD